MVYCVYSCGSNGKYQLGNGSDVDLNQPQRVLTSEVGVKRIASGGNHTLLLLENGDLLASGDNQYGQCAIFGDAGGSTLRTFTKVDRINGSEWTNCSAGYEFSVLVNNDNEIYTCGLGSKGELGLGLRITKSAERLHKVDFPWESKIVDVKSCLDHTLILLEDNRLYGFGNGRSGKLGMPTEKQIWFPRLIDTDVKVRSFDVGRDFSVISDGEITEFLGKDKFNMIASIPTQIKDFKTMWSSIHVLTKEGHLISTGNNSHGQLLSLDDAAFDLFEVGSEHGLITKNNVLYSWGWGEHGNCGINKKESVTFDYLNELFLPPEEETIVKIKGGCATTWIVTKS